VRCRICGRWLRNTVSVKRGIGPVCWSRLPQNHSLKEYQEPRWWEMLDWNTMEKTWSSLSEDIKDKIRGAGLAPDYDSQEEAEGSG